VVDDGAGRVDDVLDSEVDVRREAPVDLDLTAAHLRAAFRRAQVDEREVHRLLALVDHVAVEDDRRHVRLDHVRARAMRIEQLRRHPRNWRRVLACGHPRE
jgi:hypothetical protein